MKQFRFTLQPLLDLQLSVQEQLQIEMKRNESILAQLIGELEDLSKRSVDAKDIYLSQVQKGIQAEHLLNHTIYIDQYTNMINQQEDRIDGAQKEKDKLIIEKKNNYQELKKLEKLQEKQYAQFIDQKKRDEEKALSDMISYQIATS